MSIIIKFKHKGFTATKYHETVKQLQDAGLGNPKGRSYHITFGDTNEVDILDVWDSMEDFEAFGKILLPILTSLNVNMGQPVIQQVFGIVKT